MVEVIAVVVASTGVIVAVFSAFFVARQTQFMAVQVKQSQYTHIADRMIEIDQLFINNPNLRKYFYGGVSVSQDVDDYEKIIAVTECFLDFFDALIDLRNRFNPQSRLMSIKWGDWEDYIRDILSTSPIMCEYFVAHVDWYERDLADMLPGRKIPTAVLSKQGMQLNSADKE